MQARRRLINSLKKQFLGWLLPAVVFTPCAQVANAQCYTFSSGSAASLTVNITHLPAPTMPQPGIYQYSSSSGLTATASLTVGQRTYSPATSQPITLTLTVGDEPSLSFSDLDLSLAFESGNYTVAAAGVSLSWSGNVFPNGSLPASLPAASGSSNPIIDTDIVGTSGSIEGSYPVTAVSGCSGAPIQTGPPPVVSAPSIENFETYKGADPQGCAVPTLSHSFAPGDSSVNVFLELDGLSPSGGDTIILRWTGPSNASMSTSPIAATSNSGSSVQCFYEDISLAQSIAPNWGQWQIQVSVNGMSVGDPYSFQALSPNQPTLSMLKTHKGNFAQGQTGALYTLSVSNSGTAATSGLVTVTENVPAGLYLVSMSGQNWNCSSSDNDCTRTDSLLPGTSYPAITVTVTVASNAPASVTNQATVSGGGASLLTVSDWTVITSSGLPSPSIAPGGIVPADSTISTLQPGEWVTIYGTHLANSIASWNGDFPTSLGGTSVTINGKAAYLCYVSPGQINLQAPDDTAVGTVSVEIRTTTGTASSTVTLASFGPSFLLLDAKHVAGIILRTDGSGAFGGGTYDIIGPTGTSLGYPTVAARPGDIVELFAVGLGPTTPAVPAGKPYSGAAATANKVTVYINGVSVTPAFAGMSGAGLYQLTLVVPATYGTGDLPLAATVGGVSTPPTVVISLQ